MIKARIAFAFLLLATVTTLTVKGQGEIYTETIFIKNGPRNSTIILGPNKSYFKYVLQFVCLGFYNLH